MDSYLVVGNPIAHSKSPLIHQTFARLTGESLQYDKRLLPLDGFEQQIRQFFADGGCGCNVTLPFKEQAFTLADQLTPRAQAAGAVNTLIRDEQGQIIGDNTDGQGLVEDLLSQGVALTGRRILLLGAGGAARGAILPLLQQQPACLVVANRSPDKAWMLAGQFAGEGQIEACELPALPADFDVIINSTSASLSGALPAIDESVVAHAGCCYDMAYGDTETAFLQWAGRLGVKQRLDGLGMLVAQAAESFYQWRQVRPDTAPVLQMLREQLTASS